MESSQDLPGGVSGLAVLGTSGVWVFGGLNSGVGGGDAAGCRSRVHEVFSVSRATGATGELAGGTGSVPGAASSASVILEYSQPPISQPPISRSLRS